MSDLLALLDQLDEARAKATPGEWFLSGLSAYADLPGHPHTATGNGPRNAALIVAAVNAQPKFTAALRAVLNLHARRESYGDVDCIGCRGECLYCESEHEWPCPTVAAITAALTPEATS